MYTHPFYRVLEYIFREKIDLFHKNASGQGDKCLLISKNISKMCFFIFCFKEECLLQLHTRNQDKVSPSYKTH